MIMIVADNARATVRKADPWRAVARIRARARANEYRRLMSLLEGILANAGEPVSGIRRHGRIVERDKGAGSAWDLAAVTAQRDPRSDVNPPPPAFPRYRGKCERNVSARFAEPPARGIDRRRADECVSKPRGLLSRMTSRSPDGSVADLKGLDYPVMRDWSLTRLNYRARESFWPVTRVEPSPDKLRVLLGFWGWWRC